MKNLKKLFLFSVASITGCSQLGYIDQGEVYRLYGMKEVQAPESTDGIYQDFKHHNGNLANYWLDTDAVEHDGDERGNIKPWIDRTNENEPFMRIEYDRQGYGAGVTVAAKGNRPELVKPDSKLVIVMRSKSDACVGIKIQELDGEIWLHGNGNHKYFRHCVEPNTGWNKVEIPLTDKAWFLSPYGGNSKFGNQEREHDAIASITFALGSWGKYWFAPGSNALDIKSIEVR